MSDVSSAAEAATIETPPPDGGSNESGATRGDVVTTHSVSHWRRAARRVLHDRVGLISIIFLLGLIIMAIGASWFSKYGPLEQDLLKQYAGPSGDHWLGTDNLGRDTFSRLAHGGRTSLQITFLVALIAAAVAVPIGLASGYWSGKVDFIVMRITDAMMSIPPLVLAITMAAVLGQGTYKLILVLSVVFTPGLVRLVRAQTLAVREEGFIDASRAIGTPSLIIMGRRVLPHVLSPLIVQLSIALGTILVVETSLSFLGLGQSLEKPSWGGMLKDGFDVMATDSRLILIPGLTIALATLAFNALGDSLREALQGAGFQRRKRGDVLGTTTTLAVPAAKAAADGELTSGEDVPSEDALLDIRDLSIGFDSSDGIIQVVDKVNLDVRRGEILGLVGESGCGKTVTAMSVLRLLPSPPARILGGEVNFDGRDLQQLTPRQLRSVRGREISMVFQDPLASLNPAFTVGDQIVEAQRLHQDVSKKAARARAAELFELVGIPAATRRLDDFPHTFSGGMRQRVLLAMALSNDPKLLIADEPTTALDVTVQAQIIELISNLKDELGMSVLFVTHDLGVVRDLCDRVAVMYAGQVVEQNTVEGLFDAPEHPYSQALLRSRPKVGAGLEKLPSIPGVVPRPQAMPEGCRFYARCDFAIDECAAAPVPVTVLGTGRRVRCIRHGEIELTLPAQGDGRETSDSVVSS